MRYRLLPAFVAAGLLLSPGFALWARKHAPRPFTIAMSKEERAVHALNRLTFGPRPGDAEAVRKLGLKKWIDRQLHPERIPENPVLGQKLATLDTLRMSSAELASRFAAPNKAGGAEPRALAQILTPEQAAAFRRGTAQEKADLLASLPRDRRDQALESLPFFQRLQLFPAATPDLRRRIQLSSGPARVAQDLAEAKIYRAVYSNRQLQEVLADFWYNHFNVYLDKGADRFLAPAYERDVIRPRVLGNFSDLLRATAESPAMLFYLDNWQSAGPNPQARLRAANRRGLNENYGRELLELHTLGVDGGYTQKDVTEVARCFTGWTIREPRRGGGFEFNARLHDDGEKVVLGVAIPAGGGQEDGLKVLDILAHHPSTARFISRKLAQRFVADDPPPPLVDKMAKVFVRTGGDIREILKAMFNSPEFWSRDAFRSKVKSPFEMVASAVRASGADVDFALPLVNQVAQLGEPLYRKQEPTGYAESGAEWVNSAGLLARMNFAVALTANRVPGVKVESALPKGPAAFGGPEFQKK